jgi:2'-5' RNA ligase
MKQAPRYALVAYVHSPVGQFVESLRRELHPALPHLAAHLTVLPPRVLRGSELAATELLEDVCSKVEPFDIALGDVETFCPATPTVFVRIARAGYRLRELHDRLNTGALSAGEEFPYMPHLTVAKFSDEKQAKEAHRIARERWSSFEGLRRVEVKELTFVREEKENCWVDLAPVPLGRPLVSRASR